jgi:hypothetical protein
VVLLVALEDEADVGFEVLLASYFSQASSVNMMPRWAVWFFNRMVLGMLGYFCRQYSNSSLRLILG